MDKFGIFKLLNSFFNFYQENSATDKGCVGTSSNGLFNSLFNQTQPTKQTSEQPVAPAEAKLHPTVQTPLQTQMLNTIATHEQIVRRVKASQKKD